MSLREREWTLSTSEIESERERGGDARLTMGAGAQFKMFLPGIDSGLPPPFITIQFQFDTFASFFSSFFPRRRESL